MSALGVKADVGVMNGAVVSTRMKLFIWMLPILLGGGVIGYGLLEPDGAAIAAGTVSTLFILSMVYFRERELMAFYKSDKHFKKSWLTSMGVFAYLGLLGFATQAPWLNLITVGLSFFASLFVLRLLVFKPARD